jgi:putative transposase
MNDMSPRDIALWRFSILGPLVSARLEYGDRRELFAAASERFYEHPTRGRKVRVSARTIENWYYAFKAKGIAGLEPQPRADKNVTTAVSPQLAELIIRAKTAKPKRSAPQILRILARARKIPPSGLSKSTVLRILRRAGVCTARPREHADKERRAFLPEHAGDLWIGDAMHGPRVVEGNKRRKTYLLSIIDVATRYIVGSQFRLSEGCIDHEAVFEQALRVHGRPRTYYVDQGAAYVSGSLRSICADLQIHLLHTQTRDAEAKGAIERWHRTWRAEVGVELEGERFDLAHLNAVHSAWLGREYHAREHTTTGKAPRSHFLREVAEGRLRPLPTSMNIDEVFWHRARRTVRRDNTIDLGGRRYELSTMGLAGRRLEVRFDPRDADVPPKVFGDDGFLCDTRPLDLHANARRPRRVKLTIVHQPVHDPVHAVQDLLDEHYGPANTEGEDVR